MKFVNNIDKDKYIKYWSECPISHFMQSYGWGQAQKLNRNQDPYYVGVVDDNGDILGCALLLKTKLPLGYSYFYSPRGFSLDFSNKDVLKVLTEGLKVFMKEHKAIYVKMDPPVSYQTVNTAAEKIDGENNYDLYNYLLELGYKHKGFNKLYEGNQPRYTFRTYFDKYDSFEEVEKSIKKDYFKRVKNTRKYDVIINESTDVNKFHELIKVISAKAGFHEYSLDYYTNVFNELSKENLVKLIEASIDPKHLVEKLELELTTEKNPDRINKINKDINMFKELGEEVIVIGSIFCTYSSKGSWSLYIGNDATAEKIGVTNRLYYEFIKDAYDNKLEFYDLFGTVGDPNTKFKNLAGIFEHKRLLGGELIEFMGEFDLINKPFMYKVLPILLKVYRKIRKQMKSIEYKSFDDELED